MVMPLEVWRSGPPPKEGVYKTKKPNISGPCFAKWDGNNWCLDSRFQTIATTQTKPSPTQVREWLDEAPSLTAVTPEYAPTKDSLDDTLAKVRLAGFTVVQSTPQTLLLDIDKPFITPNFRYENIRVLDIISNEISPIINRETWPSKSGNTHVVLYLNVPLDVHLRIGLQASLGSDPVREALAYRRLALGIVEPSFLFKPPSVVKQVRCFRELDL